VRVIFAHPYFHGTCDRPGGDFTLVTPRPISTAVPARLAGRNSVGGAAIHQAPDLFDLRFSASGPAGFSIAG
jgi:hypothetical protein